MLGRPPRDRSLRVGDVLHVSGRLFTARDSAHRLLAGLIERGERPPFEPVPDVVYHCGPLAVRDGASWRVLSAGPTSSTRLDLYGGAAYAHSTGGAGALAARAITEVEGVFWLEELGMPEAVWLLRVHRFGPLLVAIDSAGGNLYREVAQQVETQRRAITERIG
ncbi:MAG: fumarate hydratase C-terminal domain-containing protein [Candidatus Bipolaricaulota bacterium]|nr:fumarate hydratase C-terminal domain-containing protein [Candidatus Bipolaricaulota bacterium]